MGIRTIKVVILQNFFTERRKELLQHKIVYPLDVVQCNRLGGDNHKCLALISIDYHKEKMVFKQQKIASEKDKKAFDQPVLNLYGNQHQTQN